MNKLTTHDGAGEIIIYEFKTPVYLKAGEAIQPVFEPAWTEEPEGTVTIRFMSIDGLRVLGETIATYRVQASQ